METFFKLCMIFITAALAMSADAATEPAIQSHFDPITGYRMSRYRAPTPDTVQGGTRVDIDELDRLVREESAVLIDVMVAEGGGIDPKSGTWRLSKPRKSLPGSVWLADVGKGELTPELENYFKENLNALTGGDKTQPIIIFCMADCWMSWNAVKRAAGLGYTRVYWYPEGTDGWRDWDRPFVAATPRALSRAQFANVQQEQTSLTPHGAATAATTKLPGGVKTATLISHDGKRHDIAKVTFKPGTKPDTVSFIVALLDAPFQDEFLSMRPFRCLPDEKEMWCHLAYPYSNAREISRSDLQDLEYELLFLFKPPRGYGIDAWNGLYFKLELQDDGSLLGKLHETDMNVLAVPPDASVVRPITHDALTEVAPDAHRFATLEIR